MGNVVEFFLKVKSVKFAVGEYNFVKIFFIQGPYFFEALSEMFFELPIDAVSPGVFFL